MNFKILFLLFLVTVTVYSAGAQKRITISTSELKNLTGCWQGTLNYSGTIIRKPYSANADLNIKQIGNTKSFELLHTYSPNISDRTYDTLNISTDNRKFEGAAIVTKNLKKNGTLIIITESKGFDHDNNQQALIRQTYTICKRKYTYTKQMKFNGQMEWIEREAFTYKRKECE